VDDESDWQRQVLIGLVVLVTVGAVVGGIVALVTIKAADIAGIDDTTANTGVHHPPEGSDSDGPSEPSDSTDSTTPSDSTSSPTTSTPTETSDEPDTAITLVASPEAVSTSEHINLTGTYQAPTGTVLQVQRREGGQWVDFPVTVTVDGGQFATYIVTGHTGLNRLRVLAIARDEWSNTVLVQVS
jgi:cytoskeletal protein RodZ